MSVVSQRADAVGGADVLSIALCRAPAHIMRAGMALALSAFALEAGSFFLCRVPGGSRSLAHFPKLATAGVVARRVVVPTVHTLNGLTSARCRPSASTTTEVEPSAAQEASVTRLVAACAEYGGSTRGVDAAGVLHIYDSLFEYLFA